MLEDQCVRKSKFGGTGQKPPCKPVLGLLYVGLRMRTEVFEIFEVRRHIAGGRVVMEEAASGVGPNRSASKGSSKAAPLGIVRSSKQARQ